MTYERNGLLLPERETPQNDRDLRDSLRMISGEAAETYKELALTPEKKAAALEAWHQGDDAELSASHLDDHDLDSKLLSLRQWKRDLLARDDVDPLTKQLYRWKVNEHIANINMMVASSKGDTATFQRCNEFIYGKPDEMIYRAALDWVAHDADTLLAIPDQHPTVIQAAERVKQLLDGKRGYREVLIPESDTFEAVRADHMSETGYYGLLLAGIEVPEGKITPQVGDPILERVIQNIGSNKKIVDADGASWGVSSRGVERPSTYNMPSQRFVGLGLGHEIGSHELERTNGRRGPLALVEDGLDRYENGNEGRAVIREQVPYESFDEFGKIVRWRDILRRHIAISFASGVGEEQLASSAETYAFMNTIDTMYQMKLKPDEPDRALEAAQKKTDELCARVLKGTDGKGGAYLKDKVYLEGHVANWLTAATRGASSITEGDLGKFDITNPRHISALQQLGLLPEND